MIDRLLESLAPHYRACILLREIEGLSYAEIAEILEIPPGTVMSRLARAREAIRAGLAAPEENRIPARNKAGGSVVQPDEGAVDR